MSTNISTKINITLQVKAQKQIGLINTQLIIIIISGGKVSTLGLERENVIFKNLRQMFHHVRISWKGKTKKQSRVSIMNTGSDQNTVSNLPSATYNLCDFMQSI